MDEVPSKMTNSCTYEILTPLVQISINNLKKETFSLD